VVLQKQLEVRNLERIHRRTMAVPASLYECEYNLQDKRE